MNGACTACGATDDLNEEGMCSDCAGESAEATDGPDDLDTDLGLGDGDDEM